MHDAPDKDDADGDDGGVSSGDHIGGASAVGGESKRSIELAAARRLLYDEAVQKRDDRMLKNIRKQMREETVLQKEASTETGVLLLKRMREHRDEEVKHRRAAHQEDMLAAKNLEDVKLATEKTRQKVAEARLAGLRQVVVNRRDAAARKHADDLEKITRVWLQTQYPCELAAKCINTFRRMDRIGKATFERLITQCLSDRIFQRQLYIAPLWEAKRELTMDWSYVNSCTDGQRRQVRCSLPFEELLNQKAARTHFGKEPVEQMYRLFDRCVPCARRVFDGANGVLRMLHVNDYVLEKTFVYGIIALSKWLGEDKFPQGVYGKWPPKLPAKLIPQNQGSMPFDLVDPPPLPPPPNDHPDDIPPRLQHGHPAASSAGP
jgi:hypothetical protein